jgi:hypothetical protein
MREIFLNKNGESQGNEIEKLEIPIDFICEEEGEEQSK